jgi:hypothetical protein
MDQVSRGRTKRSRQPLQTRTADVQPRNSPIAEPATHFTCCSSASPLFHKTVLVRTKQPADSPAAADHEGLGLERTTLFQNENEKQSPKWHPDFCRGMHDGKLGAKGLS